MGTQQSYSFGIQLAEQDVSCIVTADQTAHGTYVVRSGSKRELGVIELEELHMNLDLPTGTVFATIPHVGRLYTNGHIELEGHPPYRFSFTTNFVSVKQDQKTLLTATSHDLCKIPHLSAAVAACMTAELLFEI